MNDEAEDTLLPEEQAVLTAIKAGKVMNAQIRRALQGGVWANHGKLAVVKKTDKLLQSMRKKGLINYNFSRWEVVEKS